MSQTDSDQRQKVMGCCLYGGMDDSEEERDQQEFCGVAFPRDQI